MTKTATRKFIAEVDKASGFRFFNGDDERKLGRLLAVAKQYAALMENPSGIRSTGDGLAAAIARSTIEETALAIVGVESVEFSESPAGILTNDFRVILHLDNDIHNHGELGDGWGIA